MNIADTITVPNHSAIRIEAGGKVVWFDPYGIDHDYRDADVVFITHSHYDHFSPDDIARVSTGKTVYVMPTSMLDCEAMTPRIRDRAMGVKPGLDAQIKGVDFETVPAYNSDKDFHPKSEEWLGYVVTLAKTRYYVAGDTDNTEDARTVSCDVALIPVGGTYTMNPEEAANLVHNIVPQVAVPTHYGTVAGTPEDGKTFASLVDDSIEVVLALG